MHKKSDPTHTHCHDESCHADHTVQPKTNPLKDIGRNDPCPCKSGKKYKHCCLRVNP